MKTSVRDTSLATRLRFPARDFLIFLAFVGLTVLMTWPWVVHMRDAVGDRGDSYLNAWILWWNYHQTFTDPLHLFDANILYPYRYTLAFSENGYGISLFLFPIYALGLKPLTVHGIATMFGFAFSGYGAFRLTRTITVSNGAAWVAGVAFAFVPFRFHHLPHIHYLFAGWIPLLLEALVLYAHSPRRSRAGWLGVAFFMNALTCIHWFVLTLIPLALTGLYLVSRYSLWRNRKFWMGGTAALGCASAALLPFLLPYLRVSGLYGLVRNPEEARFFSAHFINWLTVDWQNKLWLGLGSSVSPYQTELALFPGLVPVLLALASLFLIGARQSDESPRSYRKWLLIGLDAIALVALIVALLVTGYGSLTPHLFGVQLISITRPFGPLALGVLALVVRCLLTAIDLIRRGDWSSVSKTLHLYWQSDVMGIGLVWVVLGFAGSFGMNFFFHRMLFKYITLFRSIRVPARWAMICYLGLSLLAAVGSVRLVNRFAGKRSRPIQAFAFGLIAVLVLFEQRAAPLTLMRGDVDPDPVTLRLKATPMRGGIVELPGGVGQADYLYVLRAADHEKPLVNGVTGFRPPIVSAVEDLSQSRIILDRFLDLLEAIPVSYLVVHNSALNDQNRDPIRSFLGRGQAASRLRLVWRSSNDATADELFAITKTEPEVATEQSPPLSGSR